MEGGESRKMVGEWGNKCTMSLNGVEMDEYAEACYVPVSTFESNLWQINCFTDLIRIESL